LTEWKAGGIRLSDNDYYYARKPKGDTNEAISQAVFADLRSGGWF